MWRTRVGLVAALVAGAARAGAERLPIRAFGTAEGLPHDHVRCVVPDSRGFLWLCTAQGLSRFDGRRFVSYGAAQGLREPYVNDFLETRAGEYWLATNGAGVQRLDVDRTRFVEHPVGEGTASNRVNSLLEDERGRLWAGTDDGLFVREGASGFRRVDLSAVATGRIQVRRLVRDGATFLVATQAGLLRVTDARIERAPGPAGTANVHAVLAEGGRVWTGQETGLRVYESDGTPSASVPGQERFGSAVLRALFRRADGRVLAGGRSDGGLHEWEGASLRNYTKAHGLRDNVVTALAEDRFGSLWIGTETGGVMRLARGGFVTFDTADGLGHRRVISVFESAAGELIVQTAMSYLNRLEDHRFAAVRPRLREPPTIQSAHSMLQDREGGWWAATPRGLVRYPRAPSLDALSRADPLSLHTQRDGLAADDVGRPFEDARGDVWLTSLGGTLSRWERATGAIHRHGEPDGLPAGNAAVAFGEDAHGALWLGFREGGLARRRGGGRFEFFGEAQGLPHAMTRALHLDPQGRLWAATTGGGLVLVEEPAAARPRFRRYTTAEGLVSDHVRCLTDDGRGRLYLGTAVGGVRFDPGDGSVAHFTTADGLAQNEIQAAFRDRRGALWFGTMDGASRFLPGPPGSHASPAFVSDVLVGGRPRGPRGVFGSRSVSEFAIGRSDGSVRIHYFATDLSPEGRGLFQYRLLGAESAWSAPTPRDFVEYAALSPGAYRFEVRVAGAQGAAAEPAVVAFAVTPPFWRRASFLAAVAALGALLAYRFHRSRVRRALELERVRTRIATDLHDDIGSSLSQIAIWSEVAARGSGEPAMRETLTGMAAACREAVDAMSDIVWAVNPAHDRLGDLVHRMRRFASDVFTAREVAFRFEATLPADLPLGTDLRRHLLLVFKEAVHNAVRHSGCTAAEASVALTNGSLRVSLRDDGKGFDPEERYSGHGLGSMRARARDLGGTLEVASTAGAGTTVSLTVPLRSGRA